LQTRTRKKRRKGRATRPRKDARHPGECGVWRLTRPEKGWGDRPMNTTGVGIENVVFRKRKGSALPEV